MHSCRVQFLMTCAQTLNPSRGMYTVLHGSCVQPQCSLCNVKPQQPLLHCPHSLSRNSPSGNAAPLSRLHTAILGIVHSSPCGLHTFFWGTACSSSRRAQYRQHMLHYLHYIQAYIHTLPVTYCTEVDLGGIDIINLI